jgi:hypothetical protein
MALAPSSSLRNLVIPLEISFNIMGSPLIKLGRPMQRGHPVDHVCNVVLAQIKGNRYLP